MSKFKNVLNIAELLLIISIVLLIPVLIGSIPISAQSNGSSAPSTQPTPPVNELEQCAQMLDKTLTEVSACKTLAESRLVEIEGYKVLTGSLRAEIDKLNRIVKDADERIAILSKQKCSQVSVFWGLFKIRQC